MNYEQFLYNFGNVGRLSSGWQPIIYVICITITRVHPIMANSTRVEYKQYFFIFICLGGGTDCKAQIFMCITKKLEISGHMFWQAGP